MISTKTPNTRLVMKIYSTLAAEFLGLEPGIDPDFSDLIIQHIDSDGLKRYASEINKAAPPEPQYSKEESPRVQSDADGTGHRHQQ